MSTILEQQETQQQKQKWVSFEELCPKWSLQLSGVEQEGINIMKMNRCIVGEAWKSITNSLKA